MAGSATSFAGRLLRTRWFVRAPIGLFRARLGFLFGSRLLLLEHLGRESGLRRYVVLEVVARPGPGRFVVVSGLGRGSQWYRNVLAQPNVRVSVGCRYRAEARAWPLDSGEGRALLDVYARRHPRAWRVLEPVLSAAADVPVLEFRLRA